MNESITRITESGHPPVDSAVAGCIGGEAYEYWKRLADLIEKRYPKVFKPEWLFGGKKHGWSLRYKKSKSFCTFIPEKNRFAVLIVFGAEERIRVEAIRYELSARTLKQYDEATTYHDGKWLLLTVDTDRVVDDVLQLLAIKRKPKSGEG